MRSNKEVRRLSTLVLDQLGQRVLDWRAALQTRLDARVFFAVEGAFKCNLFRGPVPSRNPDMAGREVIEIDYSCRVPDRLSPQDSQLIAVVEEIMSVKHRGNHSANGWKQPAAQSYFLGYTQVEGVSELIEIDLCVQRESETCELSDYWDKLFLPRELGIMRKERDLAEDRGAETYGRVKNQQNEEAKFRLLLALASGRVSPVPTRIEDYVDRWWEWAPTVAPTSAAPLWVQQGWQTARELLAKRSGAVEPPAPPDSQPTVS